MARTTSASVEAIIEVDASISLTPFIEAANALVEEIASDSGHNNARLELIERWLAAHFYAMRDPRVTSERAGPVGASYQSAVALRLNSSQYGQMAMTLDTSGLLNTINAGKIQVKAVWLGTPLEQSRVEGQLDEEV